MHAKGLSQMHIETIMTTNVLGLRRTEKPTPRTEPQNKNYAKAIEGRVMTGGNINNSLTYLFHLIS